MRDADRFGGVFDRGPLGDVFAELVRTGAPPPFPLEDAIRNMAVIDATFRAAASGRFEAV